ncbi:D-alanyl-D-alanine carboxypeptidase, partial [Phaeobacter sp. SYSU ZJ3003]
MIDLVKSALKLTACAGFMLSIASVPASAFDTKARAAFVLDQSTDTVLLSKNAEV